MNRRGFFGACGGGVVAGFLAKVGWGKKVDPASEAYVEIKGLGQKYDGDRLNVTVYMENGGSYTWSLIFDQSGEFAGFPGPKLGADDRVKQIYAYAESGRLCPEVNLYALRQVTGYLGWKEQRHIARIYHMDPKADFWPVDVPVWAGEWLYVTAGREQPIFTRGGRWEDYSSSRLT